MQELDEQRRPRDARLDSRLSVNQMTFKGSTFEDDVEACRDVGVRGLGVEAQKLEYGRDEEFAELLTAADIQATLCVPETPSILPSEFFGGSQDPQVRLDEMIASITRFERFRPSQFITLTGVDGSLEDSEQRRIVVEGYRRVCAAAAEVGALVGIEPIRASFAPDASIISSVDEAADLIDEIGVPNVGIVFDVWHHFESPTLLADIESYSSLFTIVQLGDAPRGVDTGMNRSIPGDGVIRFDVILNALDSAGYSGWFDIELLSDPKIAGSIPDHLSPREILSRAKSGIERAWPSRSRSH
ncbi:sugar phosphate isomerase/epimerase [Arthrobacter sp. MI7-26]|uniref:sugar phosphate isomerase/epimerase family protein n=1 Tax=Arthrobacter sp. MI7-26 TaxID=2993653 RepID=UPI002249598E|nr:sugar phosphate isomerase/epimerase family protein [Arthrobacter sp. MI7-26]MCX2748090.1 sugar phosphate isomerase/epimerase [Arthrobacter sp. MI7-26]